MARFSTKHKDREQQFGFTSFTEGLNLDIAAFMLPPSALSKCQNMKYAIVTDVDGSKRVVLKKRQGTVKISHTALPAAADVLACTYYIAQSKYILATASKLYYLDTNYDPVEIGNISGIPTFTEFHGKLIIHDSGVTKAWDGTTFETLTCAYTGEVVGTGNNSDVDFAGTLTNIPAKSASVTFTFTDGTTKTITSNAAGTLSGNVAAHELMPNQVDRDFSGASAWANVDLNTYDETGDLTITGSAVGQYCTLPVASAPTTAGKRYRLSVTATSVTVPDSAWTIKSYDGTQTIGTIMSAGAKTFDFTATTTGGLRIVSGTSSSSGTFDDFSLTTNVVDFTTGVFSFRCDGAPDTSTSVTAAYEKVAGAPKSKAGLVRASRLYVWGDADNPSRLWYSGPNDEDGWATSTSGGYLNVDPLDGYSLIGVLSYFQILILVKGNSIHRLPSFPGESTFRVEPVLPDTGSIAYRTVLNDGSLLSFLSPQGWVGIASTEKYGDVAKDADLSKNFRTNAVQYANANAYADYNQTDKQLWLAMHDGSNYLPDIYVINLATGGQLSLYQFAFGHSCFKFVNGEMLIGGVDGNLYRLVDDDSTFLDNSVSYASTTKFRSAFVDWNLPFHRKHNKKVICHAYGKSGMSATVDLYKDQNYMAFDSLSLSFTSTMGDLYINPDGSDYYIYDMSGTNYINTYGSSNASAKKFNYRNLMFEVNTIEGTGGAEFYGVELVSAILGG